VSFPLFVRDVIHQARALGQRLLDEMERYNHQVGLKIVGACLTREHNSRTASTA
jgi:hypothetical protein